LNSSKQFKILFQILMAQDWLRIEGPLGQLNKKPNKTTNKTPAKKPQTKRYKTELYKE